MSEHFATGAKWAAATLEILRALPETGLTVPPAEIPRCKHCGQQLRLTWGRHEQLWSLWHPASPRCKSGPHSKGRTERDAIAHYE